MSEKPKIRPKQVDGRWAEGKVAAREARERGEGRLTRMVRFLRGARCTGC